MMEPKYLREAARRREGNAFRQFWNRLREQRAQTRAASEIAKREERRRKQEAARLEAERQAKQHERNIQLLKLYGDIAPISVGAGVFAAVVIAIATHLTNTAWAYAISIEREGYPPLWLWAGLGALIATAGIIYARRK